MRMIQLLLFKKTNFQEASQKLSSALEELAAYYDNNYLKPNPNKTQVCAFHLRNRDAGVDLNVNMESKRLESCKTPNIWENFR
ncbi:hypothetical protein LSTR_LSTR006103 [Laodelphax striatellus]|uniref:Uncharacterized protein n=1 Tax=Laodelphax striatellus TaxID=195883 RepID=A0A482WYC0_LAOST|nr:hypothetical protein LSTR_LSTR006103 [Laodelphax striatellus]